MLFRILPFAVMLIILSGCSVETAENETSASYHKIHDIFDPTPKPKPPLPRAQPRYCYKTYEDVICYAKPIAGEEYRLVGYQNSSGKTGYTLSPAPASKETMDNSDITPYKPVGEAPPASTAPSSDKGTKQLKEIIFDPGELEPKELVPEKPQ